MNNLYSFYNGEINFELLKTYCKAATELDSLKEKTIQQLLNLNNNHSHLKIMPYQTTSTHICFFVKTNEVQESPYPLIEKFIVDEFDLMQGTSENITPKDLLSIYSSNEKKCIKLAKQSLYNEHPPFSEDTFNDFFVPCDVFVNETPSEPSNEEDLQEYFNIFDDLEEDHQSQELTATPLKLPSTGLNHLIGFDNLKMELKRIENFYRMNKAISNGTCNNPFTYHYFFTIDSGMGVTTALNTFAKKLHNYHFIDDKSILEYKGNLLFESHVKNHVEPGLFKMNSGGVFDFDDSPGIVAIELYKYIGEPEFNMEALNKILHRYAGSCIFVFILGRDNMPRNKRLIESYQSKLNFRHVDFPTPSEEELVLTGCRSLKGYGFELDTDAKAFLIDRITEENKDGAHHTIRTVQKTLDEARLGKLLTDTNQPDNLINHISLPDIKGVFSTRKILSENAWNALDDLIGLATVKEKVNGIVSIARVQQKLEEIGIKNAKHGYHMMFTGNPGTGKTTVARILGKLFKEVGILNIGNVIEVSRDGLVSIYVGNTAPKVRSKVKEAYGSILFIDEAYSLFESDGSGYNYGKEAVDALVKMMEDNREDFIVILAGYKDKMDRLLTMNQGLKDRINYTIDFPDYNDSELTRIFGQILGNDYTLEHEASIEIASLFKSACQNKGEYFSNGRLSRNIVERLKTIQACRLCKENTFDKDNLLTIKMVDVEALREDCDVKQAVFHSNGSSTRIGF